MLALALVMSLWPAASRGQTPSPPPARPAEDHSAHQTPATPAEDHAAHSAQASSGLPPFVPPLTDEDRKAAFPDVHGHTVHDNAVNYFVLFDQLEWQRGGGTDGFSWDNKGWVGKDRDRLWFRNEGDAADGRLDVAQMHLFYGRSISRWWDVVVGMQQDFRPGPSRTWAAFGIQGLAPYWFEVEATAHIGASGRTHFRFETEYELRLTNRLVLQPLVEVEVYGKSDPERGIGTGLSSGDAGLRLRYEFRREFAPYVGVVWNRKFFGTADFARSAGDEVGGARLALGVRLWL